MNLAAYGQRVCRFHGARKPETIKRGFEHHRYVHGHETKQARAERIETLKLLHELEAISYKLGLASGPRWRGPKPGSLRKK